MSKNGLARRLEHWLSTTFRDQAVQHLLLCHLADGTSEIYSGWTTPYPHQPLRMQLRIRRGHNWMEVEQRFAACGAPKKTCWRIQGEYGPSCEEARVPVPAAGRRLVRAELLHWTEVLDRD